jgi:surface protein
MSVDNYITKWTVTAGGLDITLPVYNGGGPYDFTVFWGDGTSDVITAWDDADKTHTYPSGDTYTVTASGTLGIWAFQADVTSKDKITEVSQWGSYTLVNSAFYYCSNLADITATDAPTVSGSLWRAFIQCNSLVGISGLNTWNMSQVTSLAETFNSTGLRSLDMSGWDVSNVTTMQSAFRSSSSLAYVNVSGWSPTSLENLSYAFRDCTSLTQIEGINDLSSSSVTDLTNTFYNTGFTSLNVKSWDVSNVTNLSHTFGIMPLSSPLDLSAWDTSSNANLYRMFYYNQMPAVDMTGHQISGVNSLQGTFEQCRYLTAISGIGGWDVSNVIRIYQTFYQCRQLQKLDLSTWSFAPTATNGVREAFRDCQAMTGVNVSGWDVSAVEDASYCFYDCYNIPYISGINTWNTTNLTDSSRMFNFCYDLLELDLNSWDVSNVTTMLSMFNNCQSIHTINIADWDVTSVTNMGDLFHGCFDLVNLDLSKWDPSSNTNLYRIFDSCTSITSLDVAGWCRSAHTNLYQAFYKCNALTVLDVNDWDVSNVTDFTRMFEDNYVNTNLKIHNWDISSATTFTGIFTGCNPLSDEEYSHVLINWSKLNATNKTIDFNNMKYYLGVPKAARDVLTDTKSWTITDGGDNGKTLGADVGFLFSFMSANKLAL